MKLANTIEFDETPPVRKPKWQDRLAIAAMQPVIDAAHDRRGFVPELARKLTERTGQKFWETDVYRWLHADPERRTEPLFGLGLLIWLEASVMLHGKPRPLDLAKLLKKA